MTNAEFLAQKGAEAFLSTDEKTMWYFTRFVSSYGYLVLLPEKTLFLTDLRYKEGAEKKLSPKGIEVKVISPKNAIETLSSVLGGAKKVGYQADAITA